MTDESKVFAVQMVEYNPQAGHLRKGFTVSGVMQFRAGMAAQGMTYVPSPIVPIKEPLRVVNVGGRAVGLFEFLTGKDPQRPDCYFVHQPGKPNMPVFRRIEAASMDALRNAVEKQSVMRQQAGQPGIPAPIVGVVGAAERVKAPQIKTVEQILADGRDPIKDEPEAEPEKPTPVDFRAVVAAVNDKTKPVRLGISELDGIKATLSEDDLRFVTENAPTRMRDWATMELDARVAAKQ